VAKRAERAEIKNKLNLVKKIENVKLTAEKEYKNEVK
jgi:hypothetical protein